MSVLLIYADIVNPVKLAADRHAGRLVHGTASRWAILERMTVSLGMPPCPLPCSRRVARRARSGSARSRSAATRPSRVQSMCTTPTTDVNATLQQIAELTATGCDIVRVACPSQDDADALPEIARHSQIPVIADIHFQPKYVFAAIDAGCAAVRVNPGNIRKFDDQVKQIARAAKDAGVSIRIGVNAGSLDPRLMQKYGKATAEALVESAVWEASLFEEHDFHDFKISVKHNDPVVMVQAYEQLAARGDWPLHLGVTEAGPAFQGTIKSSVAFGALLAKGIGDTIRVSLSAPPVEEIKVGNADPAVAQPAPAQARDRLLPLLRPGPGRRLHPGRAGDRRVSRGSPCRCGWPSWAASSTARGRPARPTSVSPPATARARSSSRAR